MVRIVWAIMCIFSKLTNPSRLVLLPSWANVMSLSSSGMKGINGGCSLPTNTRYARWLRLGSMRASNSWKILRNFEGIFSQVWCSRVTAIFDRPITMAKKALRFWYSLQLEGRERERGEAKINWGLPSEMRRSQDVTYYAASLMNLRTRPTRLLRLGVETSSVTIQYCTSLKRRRKTSKLAVICAGRRVGEGNHIRRKVRQHILASFNCLRESLRQTWGR